MLDVVRFLNGVSRFPESRLGARHIIMENQLHARDKVGVQDFVLLEDFKNPEAFLENLRKRYQADLIYVSMDTLLLT